MKPLVIEAKEIPYKGEYVLYMGIHDLPIDEKLYTKVLNFSYAGENMIIQKSIVVVIS